MTNQFKEKSNMNKYLVIPIIGISICFSTIAQQKLSLSNAIEIGLANNYDIRIEDKRAEQSSINNSWGEAGKYPNLDLNINQINNLTNNVKVAFPTQTRGEILVNSINPAVSLNWTIFNGHKVNISKHRLEKLQQESQGNASIVVSNTLQSIILGYYLAVLEKERLDEFKKQLELSSDKYNYLKIKAELGSAVTTDLLLEEGNYLTDSTNYINQQFNYRNSIRDLNLLLVVINPDNEYELTNDLGIGLEELDLQKLINSMNSGNVDLKKLYLSQAVIKYDYQFEKASRYPTLNFNTNFNDNRQRLDLSGATFFTGDGFTSGPSGSFSSTTRVIQANFTLTFNLFNGGKINRAIQNAIIQEDIGNVQIDKLKSSLTKDLAKAYDQYNVRKQLHAITIRKKEVAEQNLEITEEKFKNGTISSFDYRTVQNNRLIAAVQELQSIYNLIDSRVALLRLTGGLLEEYK